MKRRFRYSHGLAIALIVAGSMRTLAADSAGIYLANVAIDPSKTMAIVPPAAYGYFENAWNDNIDDPAVDACIKAAGITALRYPGGSYADAFHWATYTGSPGSDGKRLWLGKNADFAHFIHGAELVGATAILTVDYGSNQQGTGGGEPKEAAAWVAYCNGSPDSKKVIGIDSTGYDWSTVGYWANLRASSPLATDDGWNRLRIRHAAPLHYQLWEIGNEIYGNGYLGPTWENDFHAPYNITRKGDPRLSGTAYGKNVRAFVHEMKSVDPTIRIGVTLGMQPYDTDRTQWDPAVLAVCGDVIDFVIVHAYFPAKTPGESLADSGAIDKVVAATRANIDRYCGARAPKVDMCISEISNGPQDNPMTYALFAADMYSGFIALGGINIDWITNFVDAGPKLGDSYYGIKMATSLASPGDAMVSATSDNPLMTAHASRRADGRIGVMLINKSPDHTCEVSVTLPGTGEMAGTMSVFKDAARAPDITSVDQMDRSFDATVPPYSIVEYLLK